MSASNDSEKLKDVITGSGNETRPPPGQMRRRALLIDLDQRQ